MWLFCSDLHTIIPTFVILLLFLHLLLKTEYDDSSYFIDSQIGQNILLSYNCIINTSNTGSASISTELEKARTALIQCTDLIVESTIDPIVLARKLYSELVISENIYRRVKDEACKDTNEKRLDIILDEIKDLVKHDAGILTKFVDILREKLKRNDLADIIVSKLN